MTSAPGEFPGLAKETDVETGLIRLVLDLWRRIDDLEEQVMYPL